MKKQRAYTGNYPNSPDYDSSLPIGYIKWDVPEPEEDNEDIPDEDFENDNENEN